MTGADNEGLVVSPLKADLGLERNTLIDRRRFALSGHGLRLLVSAVGGRLLAAISSVVLLTVPVLVIALVIWSLPLLSLASFDNLLWLNWKPEADAFWLSPLLVGRLCGSGVA